MVLVDSSVWIGALRREGPLELKVGLEGLLEEYEAQVCPPVRLEVLGGARAQDRKRLMAGFDCLPQAEVLPADWGAACQHAWNLREAGLTVPWNDLLIATIAIRLNVRVYAVDRHFDVMAPRLGFSLYRPGYGGQFAPE